MATPRDVSVDQLVKKIEESQYGFNSTLQGPFGTKRGECIIIVESSYFDTWVTVIISILAVVYTDYTASGKSVIYNYLDAYAIWIFPFLDLWHSLRSTSRVRCCLATATHTPPPLSPPDRPPTSGRKLGELSTNCTNLSFVGTLEGTLETAWNLLIKGGALAYFRGIFWWRGPR